MNVQCEAQPSIEINHKQEHSTEQIKKVQGEFYFKWENRSTWVNKRFKVEDLKSQGYLTLQIYSSSQVKYNS
jgi:hypothetical protein